ncbi:glucosaminidase domain-containing protein [Aureivirga sp. CE67]|uniref:glucosaminidase domain-containing protein n=1 Tax=Aureivirga sp. CE67 TaxID=1788983 RepID=UPI0018CA8C9C|nr:glucosaminidase domain-containing protein [Aureivirga sp. CE67]
MKYNKLFYIVLANFVFISCAGIRKTTIDDNNEKFNGEIELEEEVLSYVVERKSSAEKEEEIEIPYIEKKYSEVELTNFYIDKYKKVAISEMKEYGIPASITLAQGILESSKGTSNLTSRSNNHFGLKCHTSWSGPSVLHDDDEADECFRKYDTPVASFEDHSKFLVERYKYAFLFNYESTDYKNWAFGLKKAGYATDPRYAHKIISIIERFDLNKFDQKVKPSFRKSWAVVDSGNVYVVEYGDTLFSISQDNGVRMQAVKELNKMKSNGLKVGQKIRIPKKN